MENSHNYGQIRVIGIVETHHHSLAVRSVPKSVHWDQSQTLRQSSVILWSEGEQTNGTCLNVSLLARDKAVSLITVDKGTF